MHVANCSQKQFVFIKISLEISILLWPTASRKQRRINTVYRIFFCSKWLPKHVGKVWRLETVCRTTCLRVEQRSLVRSLFSSWNLFSSYQGTVETVFLGASHKETASRDCFPRQWSRKWVGTLGEIAVFRVAQLSGRDGSSVLTRMLIVSWL